MVVDGFLLTSGSRDSSVTWRQSVGILLPGRLEAGVSRFYGETFNLVHQRGLGSDQQIQHLRRTRMLGDCQFFGTLGTVGGNCPCFLLVWIG